MDNDTKLQVEQDVQFLLRDQKCRNNAIDKYMTELHYSLIRAQVESSEATSDRMVLRLRQLRTSVMKTQKMKPGTKYYFVTCAPKLDTTLPALMKKTDKYIGRRFVDGALYCYEWTNAGTPHVHMLINQTTVSDRDFRKNTKNTFKSLVGNLRCIDIKSVPDEWIDDKKDYIKGHKWDEEKEVMIENDKKKRIEFDLQPYYTYGTLADPPLDEANVTND